jgi:hypothetical protein
MTDQELAQHLDQKWSREMLVEQHHIDDALKRGLIQRDDDDESFRWDDDPSIDWYTFTAEGEALLK